MAGECDPPNGKWVSIYPNGIRSGEGSYIRIWGECECTEPIIVMDDGNDVICPCGLQYTYVAAHVDVWKEPPPSPHRKPYVFACGCAGRCVCPRGSQDFHVDRSTKDDADIVTHPAGHGWHQAKGGR